MREQRVRDATAEDAPRLLAIAEATGLWRPGEADAVLGSVLAAHAEGALGADHVVRVAARDDVLGWTYTAPSAVAAGIFDLWWIGVHPEAHGLGVGDALLADAERHARDRGARLLIIETSATAPLARARAFYAKHGYRWCGEIPDFYGEGDAKVTFAKRL